MTNGSRPLQTVSEDYVPCGVLNKDLRPLFFTSPPGATGYLYCFGNINVLVIAYSSGGKTAGCRQSPPHRRPERAARACPKGSSFAVFQKKLAVSDNVWPKSLSLVRGGSRAFQVGVRPIVVLHSSEDLDVLREAKMGLKRVVLLLRIPGLSQEDSRHWEGLLNARFNECGCKMGAAFVLFGLIGSALWQSLRSGWGFLHWPWFLFRTFLAMLLCGLFGKLIGIGYARLHLRRIASQIQKLARTAETGG